ncbi:aminoglycoside phosphotransferase [Fusarium mundagurra]|uniref:Aminoglycoside phosphotransferase n=1 Tax=Fusarium mundagurra TaxID=1567541 RepID=A0A8H5Y8V9_9HYPO|nr:aminoglycoside phosphotransferase [Fusarium mundagurra]
MSPPRHLKLELEDGTWINYSDAQNEFDDIVTKLGYTEHRKKLYDNLDKQKDTIRSLVRHHLHLGNDAECTVLPQAQWIKGSFNVCIPIRTVSGTVRRDLMLRCCLPYKLAEAQYPGTIEEKLRCEVGAYVWMQRHCTDIRIPYLHGFGFADHRHYSHENHRPWYIRLFRKLQRHFNDLLHRDMSSQYTLHPSRHHLPTAYMLLEYIGPDVGQMLSNTWSRHFKDLDRRERLFRGIARAMLSLARVPQPRIGSFQFHDDCHVRLTNRPLICSMMIFENDGTRRAIERTETFSCTESFASDMISYHDNHFVSQRNVVDEGECRDNMALRTLLRGLSCKYLKKEFRNGPFTLQFTDLHASNIFVDDDWNVTCLLDLEWISALPTEMLAVPYWVTGRKIDEVAGKHFKEFNEVRQEFMRVFEEEEAKADSEAPLSRVMQDTWDSKAFWFWHCLKSVDAMRWLIWQQICPQFGADWSPSFSKKLSEFWCQDSQEMVNRKKNEFKVYEEELNHAFE